MLGFEKTQLPVHAEWRLGKVWRLGTVERLRFACMLLIFIIFLLPSLVIADSIDLPTDIGASPNDGAEIDKPVRGMTMDEVSAKYGEPTQILAPVGDPPITRWIYPNFTVNFERQYVIFAVVPHKHRSQ